MNTLCEKFKDFPCRYVLAMILFTGLVNVYAMRINLSVAILDMAGSDNTPSEGNVSVTVNDGCPYRNISSGDEENIKKSEFSWDQTQKGTILGAFFYGYVVTNIFGGRITEIVGAKWTFGLGILSTSILTVASPAVARVSYEAFVVLRVFIGLFEGASFPAFHCVLGRWIPLKERGFVFMCIQSGAPVGIVVGQLLSGFLCESSFFGGWPSAFYVFGCFGIIWSVFWFSLMYEYPKDHPRMSEKERNYIITEFNAEGHSQKNIPLPWKAVLRSIPVWAVVIVMFGNNWVVSFDVTLWPTYLNTVLHFSTSETGILSSLPDMASVGVSLIASAVGDCLLRKGYFSVTATRKLLTALGTFPFIPFTIGLVYLRCNGYYVVLIRILYSVCNSLSNPGYSVTMIDMSPTFAGTIMGISNGLTQTTGFIVPYVVSAITGGKDDLYKWQLVFYLNMTIYIACTIVFLIFGTSKVQEWSKGRPEESEGQKSDSSI